jgi:hypothetical protein
MTELAAAHDRLEAAIVRLEKALDARLKSDRVAAKGTGDLQARNEAISRRLDAAIDRLQTLLGS